MLNYNFSRVIKARGIENPSIFLQKQGFSQNFALNIINGNTRSLRLSSLEKLCIILKCTPNDVMEWVPDDESNVEENHPLNKIKKNDKVLNILKTLNSIPLDELEKIDKIIKANIEAIENDD